MAHGHRRSRERLEDESSGSSSLEAIFDSLADVNVRHSDADMVDYLIGDWGAVSMDEREWKHPPVTIVRESERPAGYVDYPEDGPPPDPRMLVDGKYDSSANDVTPRTLQKEGPRLGETYTTKDGRVGSKGGGNSEGTGKPKPAKPRRGSRRSEDRDVVDACEFVVRGLTIGEREFYLSCKGLAKEVLQGAATRIEEGYRYVEDEARKSSPAPMKSMHVYGLSELQRTCLKAVPGSARLALAQYARMKDRDRIEMREAQFENAV